MRCRDCQFYHPENDTDGECRESPPRSFLVPMQTVQGQGMGFVSNFPKVTAQVWCGAFEDAGERPGKDD